MTTTTAVQLDGQTEDAGTDEGSVGKKMLRRDLIAAGRELGAREARYLVDYFYIQQEDRKRAHNQERAMKEPKDGIEPQEPSALLQYLASNAANLERQIASALHGYSQSKVVGQWAERQVGVGPIISAGLLAHIDMDKALTAGHIWRFAGLTPDVVWEKGQKRPWNATLKTLCWKLGQSIVYTCNNERSILGPLYQQRKQYETERNDRGDCADAAAQVLTAKNIGKDTEAYKAYIQGKLPPAHIHARATRWSVKLFLSWWHQVAYEDRWGTEAPVPYAFGVLGHVHMIERPA